MVVGDVAKVEELIRNTALTKGIRTTEFFLDYDKMRTGNVTTSQFFRVIWENFGLKFNCEEERSLSEKYDLKNNGKMNYRRFCKVINLPFDARQMDIDPRCQKLEPREFLGSSRSLRPLSPDSEKYMEQLLRRLQTFYQRRGIFLRVLCRDFDAHSTGIITESQFYRSFVQPSGISEEDVAKLVQKYGDPDRPGFVNYLNISNDLEALGEVMEEERAPYLPRIRDMGDYLPHNIRPDRELQTLLDRVRIAIFKSRVRSIEFFKDYDKLRSGVITVNQFMAALVLAIGKEAQLTETDLVKIVEFYKTPDGRVEYREFCDMLENAFNVPDLEKKPTQDVVRPPEGYLGRNLPVLMDCEEARIREVICIITEEVQKRRLMLYQYFKDYDRSMAYSRVITPSQFGRILTFLSINVNQEDFRLLCRKFADPTTGDINYPAFVQTVDKDFVNYTQDTVKDYQKEPTPPEDCEPRPPETVDFDSLIQRIRHHVLVNRLRVVEYFKDFDHLRTGTMTKERFLRCLSSLGLSSLGHHCLTKAQFEALAEYYLDPKDSKKVLWERFEKDIESVFTIPNLEKMPTVQVPPSEIFVTPKPGTMDWRFASDEQRERYDKLMSRLSAYVAERRAHLYPYFKSFDRNNNGHISRMQFRQALAMALLHCSEEEMQTLESKFANDDGIDYVAFFSEVEPQEPLPFLYVERMKEMRLINSKRRLPEIKPLRDLECIMLKIRSKVFQERIRVHDWMADYDKLNCGRILKANFRRAISLCRLALQESEIAILEDHYETPGDPEYFDYLRFDDDVEKVFATKHMDKMPTLEPHTFHLPEQLRVNELLPEKETLLKKCLQRIADKVKITRMQLFPLFEDYDKVNTGCVSRSQFRRVLNELELAGLAPTETEWICLWEKFSTQVGGREDVNYLTFCDVVYGMAGFEYRHP